MLIPSTITARRTRRYTSTWYIHPTTHKHDFEPMDGSGRYIFQPPKVRQSIRPGGPLYLRLLHWTLSPDGVLTWDVPAHRSYAAALAEDSELSDEESTRLKDALRERDAKWVSQDDPDRTLRPRDRCPYRRPAALFRKIAASAMVRSRLSRQDAEYRLEAFRLTMKRLPASRRQRPETCLTVIHPDGA